MRFPIHIAALPRGGAMSHEKNTPTPIVTAVVWRPLLDSVNRFCPAGVYRRGKSKNFYLT